jgi:hypothetical protein
VANKPKSPEQKTFYFTNIKLTPRAQNASNRLLISNKKEPVPDESPLNEEKAPEQKNQDPSTKHRLKTIELNQEKSEEESPLKALTNAVDEESSSSSSQTTCSFGKIIQKANHFLSVSLP